jgi:hypothetical protein
MSLVWNLLRKLIQPVDRLLAANLRGVLDPNQVVVRTSRYLRLGMVLLVLGLAGSLFFELNRVHHYNQVQHIEPNWCLLGSISAYYYTPVHAFFVGGLVTIGVSLVAIRGNTTAEDLLLNFAGVFAPFVALVPTDTAPKDCQPVLDTTNRELNIANNVGALFVVAAGALLAIGILGVLGYLQKFSNKPPDRPSLAAYLIVLAFYGVALGLFLAARGWFKSFAHPISAVTMFALLAVNALVNGYNLYVTRQHQDPADQPPKRVVSRFNTYTVVGLLMAIAAAVILFLIRPHWHQWVFGLEATEIGLFAVFWLRQTIELWNEGLRPPPVPGALPPPVPEAGIGAQPEPIGRL